MLPVPVGGLDALAASSAALAEDALAVGSEVVVATSTPLKRRLSTIGIVEDQHTPKVYVIRHSSGGGDSTTKIRIVPKEGHVSHAFDEAVMWETEYMQIWQKLEGKESFTLR